MFDPKYSLLIDEKPFKETFVVCLGSQLVEILRYISDKLPPHEWYGANIIADNNFIWGDEFGLFDLKKIGDLEELIVRSEQTGQFIWGVFMAVRKGTYVPPDEIELDTEDSPFRSIPLDGVILEIRTFDTTFFSLFSEDLSLMKILADHFKARILLPGQNERIE